MKHEVHPERMLISLFNMLAFITMPLWLGFACWIIIIIDLCSKGDYARKRMKKLLTGEEVIFNDF